MFIDNTYLTGDAFIPNLNEQLNNLEMFTWIELWEERCLRSTIGDFHYEELITKVEWSEADQEYVLKAAETGSKWDWLINGHSYTSGDIDQSYDYFNFTFGSSDNYKWGGIRQIIDRRIKSTTDNPMGVKVKTSFLAYYVKSMYLAEVDTTSSSTGENIADTKGNVRISNNHKRVESYNKFVSMVMDRNTASVGLYHFLNHFNNQFPEWKGQYFDYEPIW